MKLEVLQNTRIIKSLIIFFSIGLMLCSTQDLQAQKKKGKTSVLVVRGGHPYDTPDFEEMCGKLKGVKADLVLTAHFNSMKVAQIKENYDAILFLNQNKYYEESGRSKKKYVELTKEGVGMVFLHFTLSSQPKWDTYHDIIGGKWFLRSHTKDKNKVSTYFMDKTVNIKVAAKDHPITDGIQDFSLTDTFYGKIYMNPNVTTLLISEDPKVGPSLAWVHKYNSSNIVYIIPGYTKKAYEDKNYRKLVANAFHYVK